MPVFDGLHKNFISIFLSFDCTFRIFGMTLQNSASIIHNLLVSIWTPMQTTILQSWYTSHSPPLNSYRKKNIGISHIQGAITQWFIWFSERCNHRVLHKWPILNPLGMNDWYTCRIKYLESLVSLISDFFFFVNLPYLILGFSGFN